MQFSYEYPVFCERLVLVDFIEGTDPAKFEFSDQDLAMLRERMLEGAKASGPSR
jgi:hypothetical protein